MGVAAFTGGIADGQAFALARLPVYLRVVHGPENKESLGYCDALDQLDDQPYESDTIVVYKRTFFAFVCGRGRGSQSGPQANYEPAEGFDAEGLDLRTTEGWHAAVAAVTGENINDKGEVEDG